MTTTTTITTATTTMSIACLVAYEVHLYTRPYCTLLSRCNPQIPHTTYFTHLHAHTHALTHSLTHSLDVCVYECIGSIRREKEKEIRSNGRIIMRMGKRVGTRKQTHKHKHIYCTYTRTHAHTYIHEQSALKHQKQPNRILTLQWGYCTLHIYKTDKRIFFLVLNFSFHFFSPLNVLFWDAIFTFNFQLHLFGESRNLV